MMKPETLAAESDTQPLQARERKPWRTPQVIVSEIAATDLLAAGAADGGTAAQLS